MGYLEVNNLITSDQSAYRNQHNTQTALHRVVDDWLDNVSDGNLTGVCSFDITKCFDTINHAIPLKKMFFFYGFNDLIILQNGFNRILTKENKLYPVEISYLESVNYRLAFHRDQF